MLAMAGGGIGADGKNGVKEEHSLIGPVFQIAVFCFWRFNRQVAFYFFKDVYQRRRGIDAVRHGKRKPVRLPFAVIRVLAEDDDFDFVKRRKIEGVENLFGWRI